MLTKIGVAALLGTIGTAAVGGGTAKADEPCRTPVAVTVTAPRVAARPVIVAPPVVTNVDYGYGYSYGTPGVMYRRDRREDLERMRREKREAMMRHARWLHEHSRGHRW